MGCCNNGAAIKFNRPRRTAACSYVNLNNGFVCIRSVRSWLGIGNCGTHVVRTQMHVASSMRLSYTNCTNCNWTMDVRALIYLIFPLQQLLLAFFTSTRSSQNPYDRLCIGFTYAQPDPHRVIYKFKIKQSTKHKNKYSVSFFTVHWIH